MFKYTGLGVTKDSLFLSKRQDWEDPPASPFCRGHQDYRIGGCVHVPWVLGEITVTGMLVAADVY